MILLPDWYSYCKPIKISELHLVIHFEPHEVFSHNLEKVFSHNLNLPIQTTNILGNNRIKNSDFP